MPPAASPEPPANALPPGTRLHEFEILGVLGVGGFGIVYRALDHALEREVAIKEYMPSTLAGRTATLHVSLRSAADAETFALGLRSFVNEARLLARFDHPSLVKVYRFWEQHDTAYMAMPVYAGRTLRALRQASPGGLDDAALRALLGPLLGAIEALHAQGVYHRDIAPDNILVEPDGRPVLLDFGAARRVIGDRSQALTAILKPAYAPIEQYAEASAARQGPWTDLYALGATLHFLLTGSAPPPATARALHDDLPPLARRGLPGVGPALCSAVDWMLALRPADRPQSVAALRAVLEGAARPAAPPAPTPDLMLDLPLDAAPAPPPPVQDVPPTAVLAPATPTRPPDDAPPRGAAEPGPPPAAGAEVWAGERGPRRAALLGLALVVAAAALAWWLARPAPGAQPRPDAQVERAAAVPEPAPSASTATSQAGVPAVPDPLPASPASAAAPAVAGVTAPAPPRRAEPARPLRTGPAAPAVAAEASPDAAAAAPSTQPAADPATGPTITSTAASAAAPGPSRPAAATAALSDDPSALCGRRVLLALAWCMERECAQADQKDHPACRKWFATNRQRPNP